MCGIAGFVQASQGPESSRILKDMLSRIEHRGPDGSGETYETWDEWSLSLGHRRLSIIDIEGGAQPLSNVGDSHLISFNGEIFNFQELRPQLEANGYAFHSRTDTEVILQAYCDSGTESFSRLNGMFAFAIWDKNEKTLTLCRDRHGIKPLYYCSLENKGIAFASELTALMVHPGVSRKMDPKGVVSYFFSDYVHAPRSILDKVFKLAPGNFIQWKNGVLQSPKPFIEPDLINPTPTAKKSIEDTLRMAVRRQLIADVPVGVFLSGGLDSSIIAALATAESEKRLKTFSIGFNEGDYDESRYAEKVAKQLGTDHYSAILSEDIMLDKVDQALNCLDEPLSDPSVLPTYFLSQLASKEVKVVLGGDGSDELWAGYPTYYAQRLAKYYGYLPDSFHRHLVLPMVSRLPVSNRRWSLEWKLKRFLCRWDHDASKRHLRWMAATDADQLKLAFPDASTPEILNQTTSDGDPFPSNETLLLDLQTYLPGSVLAKVDRTSMAFGLEVRPPFLDNEVVELAFQTPFRQKLKGKQTKWALKNMAEDFLPKEIVYRSKKGFGVPLQQWLKGPLQSRLQKALQDSPLWESPWVSQAYFQSANESLVNNKMDTSKTLWSFLVLDHWMKRNQISEIEISE